MTKIKKYLRKILSENTILWIHKMRSIFACLYYGFPARRLRVIGVTGTNGKTTVCNMAASILEEAGYKVGLATTINFKIGKKEWPNATRMTTISPFLLQKMLKEMADAGCHWAIIETTSHAIKQYRVWGIRYEIVALTNITHEHLDYHKTFGDYKNTKLKLLQIAKRVVLNKDDRSYGYLSSKVHNQEINYGIYNKADFAARKMFYETAGTLFTLVSPNGQISVNLNLPGEFNVYNALAAASVASLLDISLEHIKKGLEKVLLVPGRMEKIGPLDTVNGKQDFSIIIDYAHTPDAFEKIYATLKPIVKGKIIHVFGACGDRDKTKRPIMGSQAGRYADYIILTNEDPYTENPESIISEIAAGVPRGVLSDESKKLGENFFKILDRQKAIEKALSLAKKDDLVLVTGKGAETSMVVMDKTVDGGLKKIPWSDRKIITELLTKKQ